MMRTTILLKGRDKNADTITCNLEKNEITDNSEDYQIAICQDGKFVATFDTGKFHKFMQIQLQYLTLNVIILINSVFFFFKISEPSN